MKSGHIATLGKQLILPNSVHEAADLCQWSDFYWEKK